MIRNSILFLRRIPPLEKPAQKPLFEKIYGNQSQSLPTVLKNRYANRPYSNDIVLLKGEMNIQISTFFKFLSPLMRLAGALVPFPGNHIPVTVELVSDEKSDKILMHRIFYYPNKKPYHFRSRIMHIKNNILIELMRFGFGSRLIYRLDRNKIIMDYGGYILKLGKWMIPLPLGLFLGKFYAFEKSISENQFEMEVKMVHPLFGKVFQYDGHFKIDNTHE